MSTTLTATGANILGTSDTKSAMASSLKDAGGPSISVLTKLITVVAIVNVAHSNWVGACAVGCVGWCWAVLSALHHV